MATSETVLISPEMAGERLDKALAALLPALSRSRIQSLIASGHVTCESPIDLPHNSKNSSPLQGGRLGGGSKDVDSSNVLNPHPNSFDPHPTLPLAGGGRNAECLITNHESPSTITDCKHKVREGEAYCLTIVEAAPTHMLPEQIPLDVRYEDDWLLVINKQAGLTVHPGAGTPDGTLVNALLAHCGNSLSGIGGVARPGIVHRIDKDTSGLLIVAKHDAAHRHLSAQLADRSLSRTYTALVWGALNPPAGSIDAPIGRSPKNRQKMAVVKNGKPAVTHYKTIRRFAVGEQPLVTEVECKLETGRTHQIRVHMQHLGHPLVGDTTYGGSKRKLPKSTPDSIREVLEHFPRQALHASALQFIHPKTDKLMKIEAELPDDVAALLNTLSVGR